MSDTTVHFPQTFLHSASVRALARVLAELPEPPALPDGSRICFVRLPADFYVYRLWLDWAREGTALRAFAGTHTSQDTVLSDPLVLLMEEWCDWHGPAGQLIAACARANVLRFVPGGLEMPAFAEANPHLSPFYMGQHEKGGRRAAVVKRLRKLGLFVPKQYELLRAAGTDTPLAAGTPEQRTQALGLVMGLDCAAGRDVRRPQDYPPDLLGAALEAVQRHSQEHLAQVLLDVAENREDPNAVIDPALILHRLLT